MKNTVKPFILLLLFWMLCLSVQAQVLLSGVVTDAETKMAIPSVTVSYKGHRVAVASGLDGRYTIQKNVGWALTFSAVGFVPQTMMIDDRTPARIDIQLQPDLKVLQNVTVKAKRQRYSRKNNPAVELMREVIAHKRLTDLSNKDYYQYNKYQKLTLAGNDITPEKLQHSIFRKKKWILDQIETCPYNNKLILPISVDETVTKRLYRRHPHDEKNIIIGQNSNGIGDLFQTGDIMNTVMKDVFTDVNIYDDQVRLLQRPFTSPIGRGAIGFYRFYIEDTVQVERDSCIHLHFLPNNMQDFGFRGDLYILKDSSFQVKRCDLTIPKQSDVNFVENLRIVQEFTQLPTGEWVLTVDDMMVEIEILSFLEKAIVVRNTRLTDYAFDALPDQLFKGKRDVRESDAMAHSDLFWEQFRKVSLTKGEEQMKDFVKGFEKMKGFKIVMLGLKALVENYVETGNPSKVDIGPINTIVSTNYIDGLRTRISAQTTANLNKHWFLKGYLARGWKSHKTYYQGELTYSFNEKEYLPKEFPQRTLTFTSTYDVCSPSDKFLTTDKDNVFTAFKWSKVNAMMFYNRQQLTFEREENAGLKTVVSLKTEENEACGHLYFTPMDVYSVWDETQPRHSDKIRTTELRAEVEYSPGALYINTKQRRRKVNRDAPVFRLGHTIGIKGFLGGDYNYQYSELSITQRFWLNSWGKLDVYLKGGVQWEQVPFPLLCMPEADLSYILHKNMYSLVNNMEFLNDRFLSAIVAWDLNGKIFNRIPLLKKLKWREYIGFKMLWGGLSDKNNPFLAENADSPLLMAFPEGSHVMDPKRPYWEVSVGIHNILKVLHVEYVRRLNYTSYSTAHKHGVRMTLHFTF
ncbi:MAG: carboxypeptidase-like regulatory domain-containing protein [Prevotella sp.]|nr:carboxypeptidase-like regulatory domain-containing protein [Prevotella sp.]